MTSGSGASPQISRRTPQQHISRTETETPLRSSPFSSDAPVSPATLLTLQHLTCSSNKLPVSPVHYLSVSHSLASLWRPVCAACFKAKRALAARDPVFSVSQSGSVHSEVCFWMCCEFSAHLRTQRAPVTLCFHISIIVNILMGKCWQYFARFEMRRVCKPLFTEAGVFRQNKSSTAVSAK